MLHIFNSFPVCFAIYSYGTHARTLTHTEKGVTTFLCWVNMPLRNSFISTKCVAYTPAHTHTHTHKHKTHTNVENFANIFWGFEVKYLLNGSGSKRREAKKNTTK